MCVISYGMHLSHIFEIPSTWNEKPSISIEIPSIWNEKPSISIEIPSILLKTLYLDRNTGYFDSEILKYQIFHTLNLKVGNSSKIPNISSASISKLTISTK